MVNVKGGGEKRCLGDQLPQGTWGGSASSGRKTGSLSDVVLLRDLIAQSDAAQGERSRGQRKEEYGVGRSTSGQKRGPGRGQRVAESAQEEDPECRSQEPRLQREQGPVPFLYLIPARESLFQSTHAQPTSAAVTGVLPKAPLCLLFLLNRPALVPLIET